MSSSYVPYYLISTKILHAYILVTYYYHHHSGIHLNYSSVAAAEPVSHEVMRPGLFCLHGWCLQLGEFHIVIVKETYSATSRHEFVESFD